MFEKVKALFSTQSAVNHYYKPLADEDPKLAAMLSDFVASAKNPAAIMSLSPTQKELFRKCCCQIWRLQALESLVATQTALEPGQWFRLGQLYSAVSDDLDYLHRNMQTKLYTAQLYSAVSDDLDYPKQIPAWFFALQFYRSRAGRDEPDKVWDLAFLDGVLAAGGVDVAARPCCILTTFLSVGLALDKKPAKIEEFVWQQLGLVDSALESVALDTKLNFFQWLSHLPIQFRASLQQTLIRYATVSSKQLREATLLLIESLAEPERSQSLAAALDTGTVANVENVIERLVRIGAPGQLILQTALAEGRGGKRDELITKALERSKLITATPEVELVIPPAPPLDMTPLGDDFVEAVKKKVASRIAAIEKQDEANDWQKKQLALMRSFNQSDYKKAIDFLNGVSKRYPKDLSSSLRDPSSLTLIQAARLELADDNNPYSAVYSLAGLINTDQDLRNLAQAAQLVGFKKDPIVWAAELPFHWAFTYQKFSPSNLWPFYAEHPQQLDEALGLVPRTNKLYGHNDLLEAGLGILATFPTLPKKYVAVLSELATGVGKKYRRTAQEILEKQSNSLQIATGALSDSKNEIRTSAAQWLGRLGDSAAIKDLRAALAKEKREPVQAAMLSALKLLGDDITADLSPEKLLSQATKGLKANPPAGLDWFPMDALPLAKWAHGDPVDPTILRWWTVLSYKLKDPIGAGLIPIYVSLLDQPSQAALGTFVLDAWIAHDTQPPSDEECRDYAARNTDSRYQSYQDGFKRYPEYYAAEAALTKEQIFEQLKRQKGSEYLRSAISDKGLLALACGAPGHYVLQTSQRYIKDHGRRRAQVEALVLAASANDDSAAIQFVLSVARKFKQETVRLKAVELSKEIAERRGWSIDELADRTIPTAGFEEDGTLTLDFGNRSFLGRVSRSPKTGAFTIDLSNADGKAIKALPKPGVADDEELAASARKQLTTSKKELTQVAKLQASRLFEAMCLGRTWDGKTWQENVAAHPIMRHLISTLVWRAATTDGEYLLFRPTPEGEILDASDEAVTLSPGVVISLAHLATVTDLEADSWKQHLLDYEVQPLFSQFSATAPVFAKDAEWIDDHLGWFSDTFAIRGRATKRDYSRGQAEDGGWFSEYFKNYASAKIRVSIEFTGSMLPEEQFGAAVRSLEFWQDGKRMLLADVPPIMLAESYADYVFVAEAGAFDPDWESKSVY